MNRELGRWISQKMKGTEPFLAHCIYWPQMSPRLSDMGREIAHDGAVSATMTVYLRLEAAAFKKASTVLDLPIVSMISLWWCLLGSTPTQRATNVLRVDVILCIF